MSFPEDASSSDAISVIFNGPALAGIGATTDAGLPREKYHVLPWAVDETVEGNFYENDGVVNFRIRGPSNHAKVQWKTMLKYALWNVDNVYKFDDTVASNTSVTAAEKATFKRDLIAILFVMGAYNYYGQECVKRTDEVRQVILDLPVPDRDMHLNVEVINRAATFILARMHTKYQTNHVLGGSPMQASMASSVRAFYGVSPATAKSGAAKGALEMYASGLHWALHPANECLLIPAVIANSKITSASVHKFGPPVTIVGKEEYFTIRSTTPPASTHHFYVAAAAIQHLKPMGILNYLPSPGRLSDVVTGFGLIALHGAALHPAARYWGLDRKTANQKLVEPLCADLGYAIRKLQPGSSLAASPILAKADALDTQWKTFVDALRGAMDQAGEKLLDARVMDDLKKRIAPASAQVPQIEEVTQLMISTFRTGAADSPGTQSSDAAAAGTPSGTSSTDTASIIGATAPSATAAASTTSIGNPASASDEAT